MNTLHGLTLQKSTDKYKVPRKNQLLKRQLSIFKNDFKHWRNSNANKLHFNEWCGNDNLKEKS